MKKLLSALFPSLGKYKRYVSAFFDSRGRAKQSYSQHKEDVFFMEQWEANKKDGAIYIDVGANHPTLISNTYLLYRNGARGVCVEPNRELIGLHKKFRPDDYHVDCGCGKEASMEIFHLSKTPVLSSFKPDLAHEGKVWKKAFLPVLSLSTIMKNIEYSFIFLLSIDVEGMDMEVLIGATDLFKDCLFICIEANSTEEEEKIKQYMSEHQFEFVKDYSCNLIFKNSQFEK